MTQSTKLRPSTLAAAAVLLGVPLLSAPADAATATFFTGKACHHVWRTETGATLTQSRTGIQAEGGSSRGLSQLRVDFGSYTSTQWAFGVTVSGPRSYQRGRFRIDWAGGKDGECAGSSFGRALNVGKLGRSAPADEKPGATLDSATQTGWDLSATADLAANRVQVTARHNNYSFAATFTIEQVKRGEANMLIEGPEGESSLVSYKPDSPAPLAVTPDKKLAVPAR